MSQLQKTAAALTLPGFGILAADESLHTIENRFTSAGITSSVETRLAFRELLVGTPGIDQYVRGVILFDETFRSNTSTGEVFTDFTKRSGLLPGIKVDTGTEPFTGNPEELQTKGLDTLPQRLNEYAALGAAFTKWRAVFQITDTLPSPAAIAHNARQLAAYAATAQSVGLVPIVEPEILAEGNHTIERCAEVTSRVLQEVFLALNAANVDLSAILLKPNMVTPGFAAEPVPTAKIASETVRVLTETVPPTVAGIVFLSGGQSPRLACERLSAINQLPHSWPVSFSFGRALEDEALTAWAGRQENITQAQEVFLHRAKLVSTASRGAYEPSMEA